MISEIFDLPLEGHYVFDDDWLTDLDVDLICQSFTNTKNAKYHESVVVSKWKFPPCPIQ